MANASKSSDEKVFLLVDASILPDVYMRVIKAKQLLAARKVKNLSEAAKAVNISRSALYKYKDYVFLHRNEIDDTVISIFVNLEDRPGVLASVLAALTEKGANILTVNQSIPVDGVAPVTLSARLGSSTSGQEIAKSLLTLDGVNDARLLTNF